ncbi:hypothetical protein Hanom_Chr11g01034131 [Helianthus anomalus]
MIKTQKISHHKFKSRNKFIKVLEDLRKSDQNLNQDTNSSNPKFPLNNLWWLGTNFHDGTNDDEAYDDCADEGEADDDCADKGEADDSDADEPPPPPPCTQHYLQLNHHETL